MANKADNQQKSQSERFIETARELGCDESEERFEKVFRKIVPPKRVRLGKGAKKSRAKDDS